MSATSRTTLLALMLVLLLTFPATLLAVKASPDVHRLTQPDGVQFDARLWGDEFSHGWETTTGYSIVRGADAYWFYALRGDDGRLISSGVRAEQAPPAGVESAVRPLPNASAQRTAGRAPRAPSYEPVIPPSGTVNVPVLLINFADRTPTNTQSDFASLLFGTRPALATGPGSFADYYKEVSNNKLLLSAGPSGVRGWFVSQYGHDYYGGNDVYGNDMHPADLVKEAVVAAYTAGFDFSQYDIDHDGYVDGLVVIHQGTGEESGEYDGDIWSHRWSLSGAGVGAVQVGSVTVDAYTLVPERYSSFVAPVGTLAHEFGHLLGLPDLYDTDYTSQGVGNWSLMAGGSWNGTLVPSDTPAHMDPWSKWRLGWLTPTQVTSTLTAQTIPPIEGGAALYQFLTGSAPNHTGQYFLAENRQKILFDGGLPGAGLLIWHIDEAAANDNYECYPSLSTCPTQHYKVSIEQADGYFDLEKNVNRGNASDAWTSGTFNYASTPDSDLYSGTASGVAISSISVSAQNIIATMAATTPPGSCSSTTRASAPLAVTDDGHRSGVVFTSPTQVPPGGVWNRTQRANGETWTYTFTIDEPAQSSSGDSHTVSRPIETNLQVLPPLDMSSSLKGRTDNDPAAPGGATLMSRRFVRESDGIAPPKAPQSDSYEVWFEADSRGLPPELASLKPGGNPAWVHVTLDQRGIALVRELRLPYRHIVATPLAGTPAAHQSMARRANFELVTSRLGAPAELAGGANSRPGISAFDINFASVPPNHEVDAVRVFLKLSHPNLDQVMVWLVAGTREVVLWDGRGGTDDGGYDDEVTPDSTIVLDRLLSRELRGLPMDGPWTLYVSDSRAGNSGLLKNFWIAATTLPIGSSTVDAQKTNDRELVSTFDIQAERAYLMSEAGGTGTEITSPTVGQSVYLYLDWQVTGTGNTISVDVRSMLDGNTYCAGSQSVDPGTGWMLWCSTPWVVTAGSHTIQWDLDYNNLLAETNETNNSASMTIGGTAAVDFVAQRAYLLTGAGSGTEVTTPAIGQAVYFTLDFQVLGASTAVTLSFRAMLDNVTYCAGSGSVDTGNWGVWCNTGWTATAGSHTLKWDLDYTNSVTETDETNNSASINFTPGGGGATVDIQAQRAYLTTASGVTTEVVTPTVGQIVYFALDWQVTGSGSAVTVTYRALRDGSGYCSGSISSTPGSWSTTWCGAGWTVTTGPHTLQWDLDYTNTVTETNEANNSASKTFTPTGGTPTLDIVAQRAYLRTAASGGGSEVDPPSVGQSVYPHLDWQVTGAGSSVNVDQRAVLDSNLFCSCSSLASPATSYLSSCSSPWTAVAGSHTLQWDLDYASAVTETNETNNSAAKTFTPTAVLKINTVSFNPASVLGGASTTGTVTLTAAAPAGGATVTLSSNKTAVQVPASVAVPVGATSANFTATTTVVSSQIVATVTATYNGTATAQLIVNVPPDQRHRNSTHAHRLLDVAPLYFANSLSDTHMLRMASTGEDPLIISSIAVAGDFAQHNNCPTALGPGESCTITVSFRSTAAGERLGTLTVIDNSQEGPAYVALTGSAPFIRETGIEGDQPKLAKSSQSRTSEDVAPVSLGTIDRRTLVIESCSPESANPGVRVTLRGRGFGPRTTVVIDGLSAAVSLVDETTLTFTVPNLPQGKTTVAVVNEDATKYRAEHALNIE